MRRMNTRKKERMHPSSWRREAMPGLPRACPSIKASYTKTKHTICSLHCEARKCTFMASGQQLQSQESPSWSPEVVESCRLDTSPPSIRSSCQLLGVAVGDIHTALSPLRHAAQRHEEKEQRERERALRPASFSPEPRYDARLSASSSISARLQAAQTSVNRQTLCLLGRPGSLHRHWRSGPPASARHGHCAC